jgi:DNA-binding GntR family transcriptional regulator
MTKTADLPDAEPTGKARSPRAGAAGAARAPAVVKTAVRLMTHLLDHNAPTGATLAAQPLADVLEVSRFPIQQALAWLAEQGVAAQPTGRGYVLIGNSAALKNLIALHAEPASASPYMQLAQDRISGLLPKEITELGLAKLYGLTRMQLSPILHRLAQEGWIKRRSGHGWQFTEMIDSPQSHADAYLFRMAIEPAAVMTPSFRVDPVALAKLRAEQTALRDRKLGKLTGEDLFELGARFHETIAGFSNNSYFVSSLQRINQLRRLIEYRAMAKTDFYLEQNQEHLVLLDMLERGQRRAAASFLRRHLDIVRAHKLAALTDAAAPK